MQCAVSIQPSGQQLLGEEVMFDVAVKCDWSRNVTEEAHADVSNEQGVHCAAFKRNKSEGAIGRLKIIIRLSA